MVQKSEKQVEILCYASNRWVDLSQKSAFDILAFYLIFNTKC